MPSGDVFRYNEGVPIVLGVLDRSMSRLMSLIALIAVIVVIGLLFYKVMVGFFVPVFLAAVLVVVFRPLHLYMLNRTGNRPKVAAAATTFLIMFFVLLPFGLIGSAAALQGVSLLQEFKDGGFQVAMVKMRNRLGLTLDHEKEYEAIQTEFNNLLARAATITLQGDGGTPHSEEMARIGRSLADAMDKLRLRIETETASELDKDYAKRLSDLVQRAQSIGDLRDEYIDFQDSAVKLSKEYRTLRAEMLGGSTLAFVKDFANPTHDTRELATQQIVEYFRPRLLSWTTVTAGFVARTVIGCAILIVCVFFFLYDGPGMVSTLMALIPLDDRYEAELLMEFDRVSRAVVLATIFSALTQGAVAGLGYYVCGLPSQVLLIMLTTMCAMIPFVGPAIVWVPACLYLAFYDNNMVAALGLAAWGILVVGTVDNFVKAGVLHGQSQLHPLLALLSVLGGVQALGPIGIVVGPMAVVLLQTSLSILQREMIHLEDHGFLNSIRSENEQAKRFRLRRRRKRESDEAAKVQSDSQSDEPSQTGAAPTVTQMSVPEVESTKAPLDGPGPAVS